MTKIVKIKIPQRTKINLGGGASFISNLKKAIQPFGYEFVDEGDYDVLFIASASLCDKEDFRDAKEKNKPIILRVDNILEDSKNRNGGMPRLKEFANGATVIVYQSEWARKMLRDFCGNGIVLPNGVDTDIFYPRREPKNWDNIRLFYSRWGRGEGKNFNVVQYFWREYNVEKRGDTLVIVGKFGDESLKINHPFEFHNEEDYEYKGVIQDQNQLADIMRTCDIALLPYFADACSNTILEAQACGLPVIYDHSGGTPEIISFGQRINFEHSPVDMVKFAIGKKQDFNEIDHKFKFGLETMGEKYHGLIQTVIGKEYEV